MELTETVAFIRRYNAWRRGYQGIEQPQPYKIGQALDALCDHAERHRVALLAERALADRLAAPLLFNEGEVENEQQLTFTPAHVAALAAWKEARGGV